MQAGVLAAGLDGVENERDPGKRLDINMYTEGHRARGAKKLPLNLLDAIRTTEENRVLRDAMGAEVIASYCKLKHDEWQRYASTITQWERDHTLDC